MTKKNDNNIIIIGGIMKIINYDNVLNQITKKNRVMRVLSLISGAFIVAYIYNAFIVPNSIVYGGIGGVAIIVNKITGIDTTLFINIATILLTLVSIVLLGWKKTSYTIYGFLAYTIMVNITAPLSNIIRLELDSFLFSILVHSLIAGTGFGLIYKAGFNTGGADTIIAILQKYLKQPTPRLSNIVNGIIIATGAIIIGPVKSIYAIIYLKFMNFADDRVVLGSSTSKMCFIKSKKVEAVEDYLLKSLDVGYTILDSTNGISKLNKNVILCVLPTDRFYDFKRELQKLDKKIEIITKDCYTVEGGKTNKLIKV